MNTAKRKRKRKKHFKRKEGTKQKIEKRKITFNKNEIK